MRLKDIQKGKKHLAQVTSFLPPEEVMVLDIVSVTAPVSGRTMKKVMVRLDDDQVDYLVPAKILREVS